MTLDGGPPLTDPAPWSVRLLVDAGIEGVTSRVGHVFGHAVVR